MKNTLRLLGLFLALLLTVGILAACNDPTPTPEEPDNTFSITKDFTITRPAQASDVETDGARAIRDALYDLDLNIYVKKDEYNADEIPKNEILVGETTRDCTVSTLSELAVNEYAVRVFGSEEEGYKIVIVGNGERAMNAAIDYFISTYLSTEESNKILPTLCYESKLVFPCDNLQIMNTPIGDYTIVYAKEGVTSPVDPNYKTFIQTAKYKDAAEALAAAIEDVSGVRPAVAPDTETLAEGTPVILLGKTDRPEDDAYYNKTFSEVGSYTATLTENGTVILAGDNACAAYAAGEAMITAFCEAKTNLTALDVSATKDLIKVACVGDSITHGTTSDDESAYNYPVYLQRMLGFDYYVEKYGAPGFSLTTTDTFSYMSYDAMYQGSLNAKPDVVIIMLGTNDCNPYDDYKDWTNPTRANTFKMSAVTMINAYRRAVADVQIYLMTPPTVPQSEDWSNNVKTYAVPLITEVAESKECYLIDIYSWSLKNEKVFAGDGLHPKNKTYEDLAKAVYDGLKDTIQKPAE